MIEEINITKTIKTGFRWRKNSFNMWLSLFFEFMFLVLFQFFGFISYALLCGVFRGKHVDFQILIYTAIFPVFYLNYVIGQFFMRKMTVIKTNKHIDIELLKDILTTELKKYSIETNGDLLYAERDVSWGYHKNLIIISKGNKIYINQSSELRDQDIPLPFIFNRLKMNRIAKTIKNAT